MTPQGQGSPPATQHHLEPGSSPPSPGYQCNGGDICASTCTHTHTPHHFYVTHFQKRGLGQLMIKGTYIINLNITSKG